MYAALHSPPARTLSIVVDTARRVTMFPLSGKGNDAACERRTMKSPTRTEIRVAADLISKATAAGVTKQTVIAAVADLRSGAAISDALIAGTADLLVAFGVDGLRRVYVAARREAMSAGKTAEAIAEDSAMWLQFGRTDLYPAQVVFSLLNMIGDRDAVMRSLQSA
jgi:hypothetical protein